MMPMIGLVETRPPSSSQLSSRVFSSRRSRDFAVSDVAFRWHSVRAAPKLSGDVVVLLVELVGGGSMFVAVARVLGVAGS
jgi:hypothetical protein